MKSTESTGQNTGRVNIKDPIQKIRLHRIKNSQSPQISCAPFQSLNWEKKEKKNKKKSQKWSCFFFYDLWEKSKIHSNRQTCKKSETVSAQSIHHTSCVVYHSCQKLELFHHHSAVSLHVLAELKTCG